MSATAEKTVREVVLESPEATRVLEKLGIDYCCGGGQTLERACQTAGVPIGEVLVWLEAAATKTGGPAEERDWQTAPLAELIAHIQNTHHRFTRDELARIAPLADKVCAVHGSNHPELSGIRETFAGLAEELTAHLMKEEMILFPFVIRMEQAVSRGQAMPRAPFGTVGNPIAMMAQEHDGAGEALRRMRRLSCDYAVPADACISFQTLYGALAGLEGDLHRHIHLENNILFPRAIAMEQAG